MRSMHGEHTEVDEQQHCAPGDQHDDCVHGRELTAI
jgi:hypothetical protein